MFPKPGYRLPGFTRLPRRGRLGPRGSWQSYNQIMPATPAPPRWYLIPARVLLVTFLLTLLSFAVSLLLGILGTVILAHVHGLPLNMTLAYRRVALPVASAVAFLAVIATTAMEIRNYRQSRALAGIARASR